MEFLSLARRRCAVRSYTDAPVSPEDLDRILEAAHVAPTAANRQPVRLFAVQSEEGLAALGQAANLYGAPLAILVCADRDRAWKRSVDDKSSADVDAAILTDHMMLEATDLGLGSVWIGAFQPDVVRREFDLPAHLEPVSILAVGHPAEPPADPDRHAQTRIPREKLVFFV